MLQPIKQFSWMLLLALGLQTSWAFSLLGPLPTYPGLPTPFGDAWQVTTIGYGPTFAADIGGPKNIGEGYRRNAQTYYYACNANFLNFFGSNGVYAVDQAFTMMNNHLTNVDAYSSALTEFPLNSQAFNYEASALGLLDLKSETLGALMEQMGLANPVRFSWTLHDRFPPAGAPQCFYDYLVVQRNFDITASPLNQLQYSPYVNGTLYTYFIEEFCPGPVPDPQALAVPVQVDPLQNSFAPVSGTVASRVLFGGAYTDVGLQFGGFYTDLTRDDEAGLRYLYSTNDIAYEAPTTGSVLVNSTGPGGTNYGAPFVLFTSDLTTFILAASTNAPAILTNLYPGLIITSSTQVFSLQTTTNFIAFFTNQIGAPIGSPQKVVVVPVLTTNVLISYVDTFANVVTNHFHANSTETLLTVTVGPLNGAPIGSPLQTNITTQSVALKGLPSGDFYINTNACGPNLILDDLLDTSTAVTNLIVVASNSAGLFFSQSSVTFSNSSALIVEPIVCGAASGGGTTTNSPGLYRGIGNVQFVKTSFDALIGNFWQPVTNTYTQVLIDSTGKPVKQTFQRVVTTPDFIIDAADLAGGPASIPATPTYGRNINFNVSTIPPGLNGEPSLAGPGSIDPSTVITFDKVGTIYGNAGVGNQTSAGIALLNWASFDGSTNDPVVYPDGTSLANIQNQILVQISPASLPAGTNGVAYPATTFIATGGAFSPPFTWSLPSGGLPPGLTLSSGGTISGTPTQAGTFDFNVELTDSLARTVTWSFFIIIN